MDNNSAACQVLTRIAALSLFANLQNYLNLPMLCKKSQSHISLVSATRPISICEGAEKFHKILVTRTPEGVGLKPKDEEDKSKTLF